MDIHIVQPGDTMYRLAQQYGVPMERLIQDNQLPDPSHLVVGQTIVVQYPELTHTVRAGDSLYSIVQMPSGIPVATVAIGGGQNAGILAAKILATSDEELLKRLKDYSRRLRESVQKKDAKLQEVGYRNYLDD